METAPWRMFVAIFKKKNVVGEIASRSAHDLLYPPILKLYPLKNFTLWEIVVRKPDFAGVSRTHDMHRLALCSVIFFLKSVLSHAMLPCEGSRLDDPNQNTHPFLSAHHEDPSKTANRSWKEQQGKCVRHFFKKRIMWLGKKLILLSILKLYPLKIHSMGDSCEKT